MVQVVWTEPALEDLQRVHDFIAQISSQNAQAVVLRIQQAVLRLATFPTSGRAVPEFSEGSYREVMESGYRVIYRYLPELETVLVATVYHGRLQLPLPVELE